MISAAFVLWASLQTQPASDVRAVVHAIAQQLRDGYLDADLGSRAGHALEAEGARGGFDGITDPSDLASALTNYLQTQIHDRHLRVRPRPPQDVPGGVRPSMIGRVELLPGAIGFVEVRNFGSPADGSIDAAMAKLKGAKALVFDIGKNPGGGPEAIAHLSTYLFAAKTHLLDSVGRGMAHPEERWTLDQVPGERFATVPVYVLTSHFTFSAAESFAFGLQASGRAVVVGEATGGGGHFGGFARLPGGFEMFLPRGRTYDFRTGKDWDGKGVQPDIAVPYDRAIDAALDAIATRSPSVAAQGAVRRPIDPPERTVLNGRTVTIPLTEDGGFYFVDAMIGDQNRRELLFNRPACRRARRTDRSARVDRRPGRRRRADPGVDGGRGALFGPRGAHQFHVRCAGV